MATTRFYLDMRGKASDGKGSVVILLYHNSTQTSISTGVRMTPAQWKRGKNIDPLLQEKKNSIDKSLALLSFDPDFPGMTASQLKKAVSAQKKPRKAGHFVKEMFEEYISSSGMKPKTRSIYELSLKKILSLSGDMRLEDMDLRWLKRFDRHLSESQSANGKSIYLRALRAVLNYARDIDSSIPYPFSKFQIKHEETRKRSLTVNELCKIAAHQERKQRDRMFKDYFFLIFYLIGINIKDLLLARKSQVKGERLEYIREKTGKKYSIKIEPEAREILDRYPGKGDYLLNALDICQHYTSFAREINEYMSSVFPDLTTYWARHTWATLAYEVGVPIDIISQALGHSMGNRTTLIYVKPDQAKVDEANRKVIDYFKSTLSSLP